MPELQTSGHLARASKASRADFTDNGVTMSKIKKHAITLVLIAIAVAVALMIWSKKATAVQPTQPCSHMVDCSAKS
jgi:hypothetical protein